MVKTGSFNKCNDELTWTPRNQLILGPGSGYATRRAPWHLRACFELMNKTDDDLPYRSPLERTIVQRNEEKQKLQMFESWEFPGVNRLGGCVEPPKSQRFPAKK